MWCMGPCGRENQTLKQIALLAAKRQFNSLEALAAIPKSGPRGGMSAISVIGWIRANGSLRFYRAADHRHVNYAPSASFTGR